MEGASPNPVQEPATQPPIHPPPPQSPLSTQTLPPTPQPPVSADTRKRTFEGIGGSDLHFTKYVKMRALVHDLRPRFVEALGNPDFRNCKAAGEIREEVKALMDLFKQIIGGRVSGDGIPEEQPFMVTENGEAQKAHLEHRLSKQVEKKQRTEEDKFVVGGSAFGWNFVTVPSSDSVYYGVTKETFRAAQEINNENNGEQEQMPLTEGGVDG